MTTKMDDTVKKTNEGTVRPGNHVEVQPLEQLDSQEGFGSSADLEHVTLPHHFSFLSIVGLSYAILNSPTAMSASLSTVLTSGGPVAVCWGLVISAVSVLCIAASLAEICAVLPTTGGPYHYVYKLAPASMRNGMAYATGWLASAGWVCLTATTSSLAGDLIVGIIALLHPTYSSEPWHEFLIYLAFAVGAWLVNVFGGFMLDPINRMALFWSVVGVVVICITCLACASPEYQTGRVVFGKFVNETGWDAFPAFILGLLQSTFGLVGVDGASHMIDEMPNPQVLAPTAMLLAPVIGSISAFVILVVFLFVMKDFDVVTESAAGPLLETIYQALGNKGGAVALYMFPVCSMAFAAISILCASSRQTQAFARDRGIPFSRFFAKQSPRWEAPIPALCLTSIWVIIFGLVYLGSSSALSAILSSSVVMLQISYSIPLLLLVLRGRSVLDNLASELDPEYELNPKRKFNMGKFGYVVNIWSIFFTWFTSVFFLFPPERPTTGSNANYASAAVALVIIFATLSWIFDGRHHYNGPVNLTIFLSRSKRSVS